MPGQSFDLIGCCGFYCGSCPTYRQGACRGCRAAHAPGDCFTHTCVTRRGLRFCGECADFPCADILTREKATVLDRGWLEWKKSERL